MVLASFIVAIIALLAAAASTLYTRRLSIDTRRQATAAESATAIERRRLHDELTPELAITCTAPVSSGVRRADMTVELAGPAGLDGLDAVTVRIRDDMPDRKPRPGSQLTQEQIAEVIWGPYRLNPAVRDTDSLGREHGLFRLPKHEPYPLPLEQSMAPSWTSPDSWRQQYLGKPIRVEITCRRAGHEPWILRREVEVKPEGPFPA
jgi:hypothetical protein